MTAIYRRALGARAAEVLQARVTIVCAPLGSGKSTLLRQWLLDLEPLAETLPITWRIEHNHPSALRTAIAEAALPVLPQLQWSLDDHASGADLATFSAAVEGSARRRPGVPLVIMLDEVQVLSEPSVLGMIGAAIELLPESVRFVIATDAPMPLLLSRLRLHHGVVEIGPNELAFDEEEVIDAVGAERSTETLEQTGGWAAAVGAVSRGADALDHVRHYVRDELVRGLTPRARTVLLETAVLSEIYPPTADVVREADDTLAGLDELGARGRHPVRADTVWRHPPVVRAALLEVLDDESPERFAELMTRVAALNASPTPLSQRELDVLVELDGDASISTIAQSLSISYHTARAHARSIYAKLGVSSRAGAVRRARDAGLLPD
ncbi:helix-turn-helix transcriptional regulator [Microcella sp.]|uniref:helix-turn-helix transcriptional regulator n=1 Tax=Microcella sp. TaxID=1913979 RepID=UPI0025673264|nr:LuxR family transcriptional regulator [Microcella sp.]MBX9471712.1 hypothetical protein [Microcella sp.]